MTLLHIEGKVKARELGSALWTAAYLAKEQVGNIRLETRPKKALLGL